MLTDERRALILERLRTQGKVLAGDLGTELGISADTIRRDLRELDEAGLLRRVHGGALPRHGDAAPFASRAKRAPEAKASIARRAADMVSDGQLIVLDGGTTTLEVARAIRPDLEATVITTSPLIAVALAEHRGITVTVIGGRLQPRALVTVGSVTTDALRQIRADVVLLGVCGLHPEVGVTTDDLEEAQVKQVMIEGAADVIALADHDKLGTAMSVFVAPITAITKLVTDSDGDDADLAPYRAAGIDVLTA